MAKIPIKVYGEFVTDFVRTRFWDDKRPYKECEDLILDCFDGLSPQEAREIAQAIIEGRKKLVGVNTFELVDDGENVRYIADVIDGNEGEVERYMKIVNDLDEHMINFVDPYCVNSGHFALGCRSADTYKDIHFLFFNKSNMYGFSNNDGEDDDTERGLWLHNYPEIAYRAMKKSGWSPMAHNCIGIAAFWKAIYELIKDDSRFASDYFKQRNENYLVRMKNNKQNLVQETEKKSFKPNDNQKKQIAKAEEIIARIEELLVNTSENNNDVYSETKFHELRLTADSLKDDIEHFKKGEFTNIFEDHIIDNNIFPDDYDEWEGLIAPNGDFYSCTFGGHNGKAYSLLCAYPEKFPKIDYNNKCFSVYNALDTLLNQGWCATRTDDCGNPYLDIPSNGRITKAQENAIFDVKIKYDIDVDLEILGY